MNRPNTKLLMVGVLFCCIQSGCQIFNNFHKQPAPPPGMVNQEMNLDQIILAINDHNARVNQLKTDVRVSMDGAPTMRGTLTLERPKRMRMKAGVAGLNAVDIGSNSERFWIWTKAPIPGQPPTLMYARHVDFQTSAIRRNIPLDPLWLIDGLGFAQFEPTDRHEGPRVRPQDGMWEIVSYRKTASGENVRVCAVDPKTGLVMQQSFYDQNMKLIAYLNSIKHQYYEEHKVSLPQRVVIHVVGENDQTARVSVDTGDYSINSLYGDPEKLWSMPNPPDVKKVDLSTVEAVIQPTIETTSDRSAADYLRRQPSTNTQKTTFQR